MVGVRGQVAENGMPSWLVESPKPAKQRCYLVHTAQERTKVEAKRSVIPVLSASSLSCAAVPVTTCAAPLAIRVDCFDPQRQYC